MKLILKDNGAFEVTDSNGNSLEYHENYMSLLKNTKEFDTESKLVYVISVMHQNGYKVAHFGVNRTFLYAVA